MLVKVCGITGVEQYRQVEVAGASLIGLNFYPPSSRYVAPGAPVTRLTGRAARTGVFVNPCLDRTLATAKACHLDYVQLHGREPAAFCQRVKPVAGVIKAFGLHREFDWSALQPYLPHVNYFLFDTRTSGYGGSGRKFDWDLLQGYRYDVPFFLSGGLRLSDWPAVRELQQACPALVGIDINSGFETAPGVKDIKQIETLLKQISHETPR